MIINHEPLKQGKKNTMLRITLTETSSLRFSSVISEISDKSTDSSENEADEEFTLLFEIWRKKQSRKWNYRNWIRKLKCKTKKKWVRSLGIGECACLSGFLRRKVIGSCGAILCGARCREFGWCLLLFHLAGSTICGFQFQLYL